MLLEWFRNIWAHCQPDGDHLWLSWLAAADHPSMTLQDLQMCEQYFTLPQTAKWPRWLVRWREKDWSATTGWSLALVCSSSRPSPFSTTILVAQLKGWMDFAATLFHGISQHDLFLNNSQTWVTTIFRNVRRQCLFFADRIFVWCSSVPTKNK